jgi:hypothetical protein
MSARAQDFNWTDISSLSEKGNFCLEGLPSPLAMLESQLLCLMEFEIPISNGTSAFDLIVAVGTCLFTTS